MPKQHFELHPVLHADCHALGRLGDTQVLLHRNALLHWLILVPETSCLDLLDLPEAELNTLLSHAKTLSGWLKQHRTYPRVNVGALGLLVPQLHLHVIGRREGDPCWPQAVWGNLDTSAVYAEAELEKFRSWLRAVDA